MAALTITPEDVGIASETTQYRSVVTSGATTQGQPLYKVSASTEHTPAESGDTGAKAKAVCLAITPSAGAGVCVAAFSGLVVMGATLAVGTEYYLSATAGGIVPRGDLVSGDWITRLGIATTTSILDFQPDATAVQVP